MQLIGNYSVDFRSFWDGPLGHTRECDTTCHLWAFRYDPDCMVLISKYFLKSLVHIISTNNFTEVSPVSDSISQCAKLVRHKLNVKIFIMTKQILSGLSFEGKGILIKRNMFIRHSEVLFQCAQRQIFRRQHSWSSIKVFPILDL